MWCPPLPKFAELQTLLAPLMLRAGCRSSPYCHQLTDLWAPQAPRLHRRQAALARRQAKMATKAGETQADGVRRAFLARFRACNTVCYCSNHLTALGTNCDLGACRSSEHEIPRQESWKATSQTACWATSTPCTTSGALQSSCQSRLAAAAALDSCSAGAPDALKNIVGLATKKCKACEGKDTQALTNDEADKLRQQVPGWRLVQGQDGVLSIRQDWKVTLRCEHGSQHTGSAARLSDCGQSAERSAAVPLPSSQLPAHAALQSPSQLRPPACAAAAQLHLGP